MNISIINIKNKIRELKKERDAIFSIIDDVNYDTQSFLINSIIELTNEIYNNQKRLEVLINETI